jgi:hypothetical protein
MPTPEKLNRLLETAEEPELVLFDRVEKLDERADELEEKIEETKETLSEQIGSVISDVKKVEQEVKEVEKMEGPKGDKGDDGKTPTEKEIRALIPPPIKGEPGYTPKKGADYFDGKTPQKGVDYLTPDEVIGFEENASKKAVSVAISAISAPFVRDKLESLEGEERLDKSAIKGMEKLEEDIKNKKVVAGRSLLQLYVDGAKKGAIQYVNFVAGTGIILSYNRAFGRNDITVTATGSASLTPIAVTGTIDDTNTSFTAASAPNLVIINGAAYRDGKGVTISGTAITTANPVGTGGDIYAL